jgi:hypothetical protein
VRCNEYKNDDDDLDSRPCAKLYTSRSHELRQPVEFWSRRFCYGLVFTMEGKFARFTSSTETDKWILGLITCIDLMAANNWVEEI